MIKQSLSLAAIILAGTLGAQAQEAVAIGNSQKEFPESVTSTADGTLYTGSMTMGVIFKAAPGADAAEIWIEKPAEGPQSVVGVFADEANGTLWACFADLAGFGGDGMPSELRAFDLSSGEVKGNYPFPGPSFCNDIATTADGAAYAADTGASRIMLWTPGTTELEEWLKDDQLAGVDGLSFGPDGALYVNSVSANKLFRIDMDDKAITELTLSEPVSGPDGMRFGADGKLYVAENAAGRVSALTIEGDEAAVNPVADGYEGPTAVTLVDGTLWVLEAKIGMLMSGEGDPGQFLVHRVELGE